MIGSKLTATYTPDNGILTPDPAAGAWGDALGLWADYILTSYGGGSFGAQAPEGEPTFGACDYVNTSDSSGPAIRMVLVYDGPFQEIDLAVAQTAFETACSQATAKAAMAAFDSAGAMSYVSAYVEQWSDEETP